MTNSGYEPPAKEAKGLLSRGSPREIRRGKITKDLPGLYAQQPLSHCLIKKENCQNGENNAECCQSQTVKTNLVGVGVAFSLIDISLSRADRIAVCDVCKRVRRLKDRDERQRQYQD
jgi:hypothetical protein